jgi:hypothetical protein
MRLAQFVIVVMVLAGIPQSAVPAPADGRTSCWEPDGDLFIDCDQNQTD